MPSDTMTATDAAAAGAPAQRPARPLREIADLPGPKPWPVVGNLLQFARPQVHSKVEEWVRRYGPFCTFLIGNQRLLIVGDHEAMQAILRDRPDGFRRTPRTSQLAAEMGISGGVFGAEGEAWKRQRRMVMAGFEPRRLRAYFPQLVVVCARLESRWRQAARLGRPIDLQADLMRFTVDAVAGLAFGSEVNTLESDDDVIQRHLDKIFPALHGRIFAPVPTWRWWKTRADRELDASVVEVNRAIDGFVRAARERLAADPARREEPKNLLEAMIVAADDPGSGISPNEVSGNVMTMLLAGEDTTANSLAWAVWLLSRHPEALRRAQAEVDAEAGAPGDWTLERFARLDWVEACTSETMRLRPVAPVIALQALRDTVVADIRVPKGALVFGSLRSPSLRDEHFADADRFLPERWLGEGAARNSGSANRVVMPFGAGPRVCPGRNLATLEIKMALATLLQAFDIESVTTDDGSEPEERMSFTMAPAPLRMRLRERLPAAAS